MARRLLGRRRGHRPSGPARASKVGVALERIEGRDPAGAPCAVPLGDGRRVVIAFLTSSCVSCRPFWTGAATGRGRSAEQAPPMIIVTPDAETEDRSEVDRRQPDGVPVVMSTATWLDLEVRGSPFFMVVADGRIRTEGWAGSWAELLDLIGG